MAALKNKKLLLIFILAAAPFTLGVRGFVFYRENLRGIGPAIFPSAVNLSDLSSATSSDLGLKLPEGFRAEIFAKNLPGARVMKFDSFGNLWVSRTNYGAVSLVELKDGRVQNVSDVFKNLNNPHGLAFDPDDQFSLEIACSSAM